MSERNYRFACPVCGDPNAYPFWIDENPPATCPNDQSARTICSYQIRRGEQQAEFRRLLPDAYDENGNIKPGRGADVLLKWAQSNPTAVYLP